MEHLFRFSQKTKAALIAKTATSQSVYCLTCGPQPQLNRTAAWNRIDLIAEKPGAEDLAGSGTSHAGNGTAAEINPLLP
ncbi:MAG: hypothetical protein CMJ70_14185 [Planctomycetaceae bacterium]|nr:hypothetical protein [Planctomycetaceae bacterium]HAA67558.1 hypothetical protein [Planctomycetaceae bacterium]